MTSRSVSAPDGTSSKNFKQLFLTSKTELNTSLVLRAGVHTVNELLHIYSLILFMHIRARESVHPPSSPALDVSRCFSAQTERATGFYKHTLRAGGKCSKDPQDLVTTALKVDDRVNKSENGVSAQSFDRFSASRESVQSMLAPLRREQIRK